MKTMSIELSIYERFIIPQTFPQRTNFEQAVILSDLKKTIKVAQEEIEKYQIITVGELTRWEEAYYISKCCGEQLLNNPPHLPFNSKDRKCPKCGNICEVISEDEVPKKVIISEGELNMIKSGFKKMSTDNNIPIDDKFLDTYRRFESMEFKPSSEIPDTSVIGKDNKKKLKLVK